MATIEIQVGGKVFTDLVAAFDHLGDGIEKAFDQGFVAAKPALMQQLYKVAQKMKQMHGNPWGGGVASGSKNLQRRSGDGLESIFKSIQTLTSNKQLVMASISAGSLSFHEEGGTIRAKSAQYLTIPLPAAMDPRGVPLRERARQWDNTFVKKSKKGNLIIFRKIPGARELTPLYILKTSVYIRPRLRMEPTFNDVMGYFDNILFERISNLIDQNV